MSSGSSTESYPAFARIELRENPGKNLNQVLHKLEINDYAARRAICYDLMEAVNNDSLIVVKHRIKDANNFLTVYKSYFGIPMGVQDKTWAPDVVFRSCRSTHEAWYRGESRRMKFGILRIWCEPTDHLRNCYFCVVDLSYHGKGTKTNVFEYSDLPSPLRPIAHEEFPVFPPPGRQYSDFSSSESCPQVIEEEDFSGE
ncbi:hypothetical protein ANN_14073 [Periplaneta americana]|uniref:Uncharacterized protein n=1 Tax=Periplaneta americana TaxID=6978 RepID=A0ABQ8SVA1_PERAM|nr:hypothetical protein ANN_14073 [Periplaneta americana]